MLWHKNVLQMLFSFLQRQQIQTIERTNKIYSKTCLLCEIMCNILYTGTFLVCRNGPAGNYHKFATLVGEQTPACSTKESVSFSAFNIYNIHILQFNTSFCRRFALKILQSFSCLALSRTLLAFSAYFLNIHFGKIYFWDILSDNFPLLVYHKCLRPVISESQNSCSKRGKLSEILLFVCF